jgi:glycosyltransferase involved in cell wall biosynthesis
MPVILQALPNLVTGGAERSTIEMTAAIANAGWTALVASAGGRLVPAIESAGGRHIRLPLDTKNPRTILQNARRLTTLIREAQVDVVHARSRAPAWSAWLAVRRTGCPFVTTYHGAYAENLPLKRYYNAVMAKGDIIIAASRYVADLVASQHGVDRSRIRLIPRGVDPTVFDPEAICRERTTRLAGVWHLPPNAPLILLPARITGWKGQSVLLDALARLSRRDPVAVLLGSDQGRTHLTDRLQRQASRLGIADRVCIPGDCEDVPAAMGLADVVVHASTEPEAFGRVVIEAQAMARCVIASDLGGPVETVEHGLTGWRVPPGDPRTLAAMLDHVLTLPAEERIRVGQTARSAVLARFTTRACQEGTLAVYREILEAGESKPKRTRQLRPALLRRLRFQAASERQNT